MRWEALLTVCAVGLVAATVGATEKDDLPAPWFRSGNATQANCHASVDAVNGPTFARGVVLRCNGANDAFVSAMQQVSADDYRGKRIRLSGQLRGESVANWAGLWMRVDGEPGKTLAFDNMQSRAPKGTFAWQRADVVLDVAQEAKVVSFGVIQAGDGATSFGGIAIDVVDDRVPITEQRAAMPKQPTNLSFGK